MFYVHIRVGAKRSLNVSPPTEYLAWRGEQGKNTSSAFQYHCILLHAMLLGVGEKNNGRFNIAGDVLSPFRVLQLFWNVKFDRCLCYRVARKIGLCCRPDLTKDLWEEVLCRVNTVSMTILPSQFKCDGNFVLPHLNSKKKWSLQSLHMVWQLCCRGICKNIYNMIIMFVLSLQISQGQIKDKVVTRRHDSAVKVTKLYFVNAQQIWPYRMGQIRFQIYIHERPLLQQQMDGQLISFLNNRARSKYRFGFSISYCCFDVFSQKVFLVSPGLWKPRC